MRTIAAGSLMLLLAACSATPTPPVDEASTTPRSLPSWTVDDLPPGSDTLAEGVQVRRVVHLWTDADAVVQMLQVATTRGSQSVVPCEDGVTHDGDATLTVKQVETEQGITCAVHLRSPLATLPDEYEPFPVSVDGDQAHLAIEPGELENILTAETYGLAASAFSGELAFTAAGEVLSHGTGTLEGATVTWTEGSDLSAGAYATARLG